MTSTSQLERPLAERKDYGSQRGLNLLMDPWIPVQRADGTRDEISPAEIRDFGPGGDNPPVALAAIRPDLNGALIQFLVGVFQTALAPESMSKWRRVWQRPPSVEELKEQFKPFAYAFELEGEGPRFLQDLDPLSAQKPKPLVQLLFDSPAGQSLNHNKDHFIKDRGEPGLCPRCAAMALLTLQLNAPSGGAGHRTSLRGGGPLTTIVVGSTLWETVWLNVLSVDRFSEWTPVRADAAEDIFPWLGPTRTSEKKTGTVTTPQDAHPAQIYWNMPRRMRLRTTEIEGLAACELCQRETAELYHQYADKNYGVNYEGPWVHPLTPHAFDKKGQPNPAKGQPGGLSYRHWRGYVINHRGGNLEPAQVVYELYEREQSVAGQSLLSAPTRLWVFGYDADNAKIRSWNESMMPIYSIPEAHFEAFERRANDFVGTADFVAYLLSTALKNALYGSPTVSEKGKVSWHVADGVSTRAGLFQQIDMSFWQQTEDAFYQRLGQLREALLSSSELSEIKQSWGRALRDEAMRLFDANSQVGAFYGANPKAVALARRNLALSTTAYNKKFRTLLDLPKPEKTKKTLTSDEEPTI